MIDDSQNYSLKTKVVGNYRVSKLIPISGGQSFNLPVGSGTSQTQFEIVGNMDDHPQNRTIGVNPISEEFIAGYRAVGGTGAQRAGGYWVGLTNPHRFPYKRIFIRHKGLDK